MLHKKKKKTCLYKRPFLPSFAQHSAYFSSFKSRLFFLVFQTLTQPFISHLQPLFFFFLTKKNKEPMSQQLSPQEQRLLKLYGKLPNSAQVLSKKIQDRKYFDSGDYALSKTSQSSTNCVGSQHPSPESIPHNLRYFESTSTNNYTSTPRRPSVVTTHVMNASDSLTA